MQNKISRSAAFAGPAMLWAWQVVDTEGNVLIRGESRNYLDALAGAMAAKSSVESAPLALPEPSQPVRESRRERRARRRTA
jgi:hypothetical protein